jgi:hypothetical protein
MAAWSGTLTIGVLLATACWFAAPAQQGKSSGGQNAQFKISTQRMDDTIEILAAKDQTVFIVKSPFGISKATIERLADKWPQAVVLRLHLKGLEGFQVTNAKVRLNAAVSFQGGKPLVRVWKDGKENPGLDDKSPFWIPTRVLDADGKPARELPLKDGYVELALPTALFEDNPPSISLQWIDFYRQ